MQIYEVEHDDGLGRQQTIALMQETAAQFDFVNTLEQHKPTRSHWHWQRRGKSGTLEVTFDVAKHQLFMIVHDNRADADGWAKKYAARFARALANSLKGKAKKIASQRG